MTGRSRRSLGYLLLLMLSVGAVGFAGKQIERQPRASQLSSAPIYLPQAKFLRPLSLGYHNVLADILWFRTISYFGAHYRTDRTYPWLAYMCELVTDLDPRAEYVYRFAGVILPWEAQQVDAGVHLLEKGVGVLPNSWLLHYWLGFTYYFFMGDYDHAIAHMQRAAELPDAHPVAARLAAVLYRHEHGPELTLQFLAEMERDANTDEMRAVVRRHLREAKLAADLARLTAAVKHYRARFERAPDSLRALVAAGLLNELPVDPFGGVYELDPESGVVRSSTGRQPLRLHRSQRAEAASGNAPLRD
ncbi:MAG: tetratricopeptide repeat protein [Candidatus Binatia bacterium]